MTGKFLVLCLFVATATSYQPGCQYQCYSRVNSVEQTVNQMNTKLNTIEGRQSSATQSLMHELTVLDSNSKTVKSVVNTLVEDNVKMHSDIRMLKGHGDDIVGLRRQFDRIKQSTESELAGVRREIKQVTDSLGQKSQASEKVTVFMSNQMKQNQDSLTDLKKKVDEMQGKIGLIEDIQGMIAELTGRMDGMQEQLNRK